MSSSSSSRHVAVIGTGLVGCLAALGFATQFGWTVDIYDARSSTSQAIDQNRTINLALSNRGIRTFEEIDPKMTAELIRQSVPLYGRTIHKRNGATEYQAYGPHGEAIYSINRLTMIALLKDAITACPLIKVHYSRKLIKSEGRNMLLEDPATREHMSASADLIVGADGAYSALREQMRRVVKMDLSTRWAPLSYMKIEVPPIIEADGSTSHAFDPAKLHVWPRKDFLLIAPSNTDKTFTCVLWAPEALLERLRDKNYCLQFFSEEFPSFMAATTHHDVVKQVTTGPIVHMSSTRCFPMNDGHRILIGDAAHAIVPYLGHGANVGFEDVRILLECLKYDSNQKRALDTYSKMRHEDLEAIEEISWGHNKELGQSVLQWRYKVRKSLDFFLARVFPGYWAPLYAAVTFEAGTPYSKVIERHRRQEMIVAALRWVSTLLVLAAIWKTLGQPGLLPLLHLFVLDKTYCS
ncbi:FAD/NAD(P)-binding domain-containing protein [Heliocybe sulcata]|uniref:FAD/NAD(P)-binding domain-containing protein n=1 Tax=Heliocybe sulcata TaxID=5364 RepID=A0A5C3NA28_9AGAM|nr:FAD/NAD(P)-binding domain-containing protein [Heliocybe sulcata]